jgi:spore coat polysaccharide biosynthesis predicted glycosyltransferase SpsG
MVSEAGCDLIDVTPGSAPTKRRAAEEVVAAADQLSDAAATRDAVPKEPFEWVIVDHYGLDAHWESAMRSRARRILVIDDLTNRPHDCALLLDQNPSVEGGCVIAPCRVRPCAA